MVENDIRTRCRPFAGGDNANEEKQAAKRRQQAGKMAGEVAEHEANR